MANDTAMLDTLHAGLMDIVNTLDEVELLASDPPVEPESAHLVTDRLVHLTEAYSALDDLMSRQMLAAGDDSARTTETTDVDVPQDVLEYIEQGRNPNVYTRQFSEAVVRDNQAMAGKMQAHADFAQQLEAAMLKDMPELADTLARVKATKATT
ncbi:RNA polymerase II mediator complex subunit [Savitreella phatthalungensis]